jgi:uncharacterized protein
MRNPAERTWNDSAQTRGSKTMAAKFELYTSPNGEYRWRLRSSNRQVIATGGEGYSSKAAAQGGIESVKRDAASAPVVDA